MAGIPRSEDPVSIRNIIGVVAHQPMLYQDMSAGENLLFFSRMYRIADPRERVAEVTELLGQGGMSPIVVCFSEGLVGLCIFILLTWINPGAAFFITFAFIIYKSIYFY